MKAKILRTAFVLITMTVMTLMSLSPNVSFASDEEVKVYGWVRNNLGMFTDQVDYAGTGNDLSTCRTWVRAYVEYEASNQLSMWTALQLAHEPTYKMEKGSLSSNAIYQHWPQFILGAGGAEAARSGKEYSEYRDINDVLRECFIRWKPNTNHTIKLGRQIVIWGESMTTRVGDVIHPDDGRYALGFANLEDSRIPLWMVRGMHYFEELKGLELDWLISPNITRKEFTVGRSANYASVADLGGGLTVFDTGQRLGIRPDGRNPTLGQSKYPTPLNLAYSIPIYVEQEYPSNSLRDLRFGFRLTKYLMKTLLCVSYFHTQNYTPSAKLELNGPDLGFGGSYGTTGGVTLVYPNEDIFGVSASTEMPKGLMRAEAIYIPNRTFNVYDPSDSDRIDKREYIKYMLAYDVTFFFQWNKSAPLNITVEHVGEYYPDNDYLLHWGLYSSRNDSYTPYVNCSARMSFKQRWEAMQIVSFQPRRESGLTISQVAYKPVWMNNAWQFTAQYIRIFSEDYYHGLGPIEQKDQVVFTTQYNFSL